MSIKMVLAYFTHKMTAQGKIYKPVVLYKGSYVPQRQQKGNLESKLRHFDGLFIVSVRCIIHFNTTTENFTIFPQKYLQQAEN